MCSLVITNHNIRHISSATTATATATATTTTEKEKEERAKTQSTNSIVGNNTSDSTINTFTTTYVHAATTNLL